MKKGLKFFLKLSIGIVILFVLFYKIGFLEICKTIIKVNIYYLILVVLLYIFPFIIATLNIKILLDPIKVVNFWRLFKYYMLSWSIGLFVPGKIGEFSLIYFLKKADISVGQGTAVSIIDKIITAITLSFLTVLTFFIFFTAAETIRLILILFVIFMILLFFMVTKIGREIIKKYILRKYAEKFKGFSKTFFYYLKNKKIILFINFILTFVKWILNSVIIAILFLAFDINVNFFYIILITATTTIVSLIPITISGLGVKESVAVFLFNQISVPAEVVVSVFLIFTILSYIVAALSCSLTKIGNKRISELDLTASDTSRK